MAADTSVKPIRPAIADGNVALDEKTCDTAVGPRLPGREPARPVQRPPPCSDTSPWPCSCQAATDELKRLAGLGVKAIKLHPHTQEFDITDPKVRVLCKLAGELGVAVLFDNFNIVPGDSQYLFNLAVQLPKTHFVFAHMGGMDFRFWNLLFMARTAKDFFFDNIHFDISATAVLVADSPLEAEFVWTIRNVGIDDVMLGSAYPQLSLKQAVDALEKLDLSAQEKRKIRWDNANRLFGDKR
ncbi:amidohydrolase family protein [Lysobacter capsici]|uniref:amidohydrolase family protein n=1 Tax=Lysobacter capsici TaxID=435897 RepID=UPI002E152DF7